MKKGLKRKSGFRIFSKEQENMRNVYKGLNHQKRLTWMFFMSIPQYSKTFSVQKSKY